MPEEIQSSSFPNKTRQTWVDIYKGLAILAIVLGHTNSFWPASVYLFHIAAFFFIAGYTSNTNEPFANFLLKKIKTLILPFWIFNAIFVLIHYFVERYQIDLFFKPTDSFDLLTQFNNILLTKSTEDIGGATWFLIALFVALVTFQGILKVLETNKYTNYYLILTTALCLITTFYLNQGKIHLAYMIDMIPMALAFIIPGYLFRQTKPEIYLSKYQILAWGWIPLIFVINWILKNTWFFVDFAGRKFESPWLIFSNGLIGILLLISLAKFIERYLKFLSPALQACGVASLWIMCGHFLFFRLGYLILYGLGIVPEEQLYALVPLAKHTGYWVFHTLIAVIPAIILRKAFYQFRSEGPRRFATLLLLLAIGLVNFNWLFSPNHFYFADDFSHLFLWVQKDLTSFLSFIPQTMYNDRPFGQVFYKILADCFGGNYRVQHLILFLIHILNGFLLTLVVGKITCPKNARISLVAIFVAGLFLIWPQTNIPVQWISAAFDLLGATFVLSYLLVYFSGFLSKTKIWRILLLSCLVIGMARTKESTLLFPSTALLLDIFLFQIQENKIDFKKYFFIIKCNALPVLISFAYILYLVYLRSQAVTEFQAPDQAYFTSMNPGNLFSNTLKYLYLFSDLGAPGQVFKLATIAGVIGTLSFWAIYTIPIAIIGQRLIKLSGIFFLVLFLLTLLPVLPLVNMQHELYLYLPSIWIFIGLAFCLRKLLDHNPNLELPTRLLASASVLGILFFNNFSTSMSSQTNWYLLSGKENRQVFKALEYAQIPPKIKILKIYNVTPGTNILQFGQGHSALNLAQGKTNNLKIYLSSDSLSSKRKTLPDDTWELNYKKLARGIFKPRIKANKNK